MFSKFDTSGDGAIDLKELNQMLKTCGMEMQTEELAEMVSEFDLDGDGKINFEEFITIFVNLIGESSVDQMTEHLLS